MRMPFEGLSLMDYAINTSLVISNIALQSTTAPIITFSDKIGATIKADSKPTQLNKILMAPLQGGGAPAGSQLRAALLRRPQAHQRPQPHPAVHQLRKLLRPGRVLPILRRINAFHLWWSSSSKIPRSGILSRNGGNPGRHLPSDHCPEVSHRESPNGAEVAAVRHTAILTRPEDLSINTVNKYLELKSRG